MENLKDIFHRLVSVEQEKLKERIEEYKGTLREIEERIARARSLQCDLAGRYLRTKGKNNDKV